MSTKMRKRKKPSYLNDFVQNPEETEDVESPDDIITNKKLKGADDVEKSERVEKEKERTATEDEARNEKEVQVDSVEGQCSLCEEKLDTGQDHEDIETATGSSDSSYATILTAVFKDSQHFPSDKTIPRLLFSSGKICRLCKNPIKQLDLLQNKIIGLKKVIFNRASKKLEGISGKQKEVASSPDPDVDTDNLTKAKKKKRLLQTAKKVSFEKSPSVSVDVEEEIVEVAKVKKKKKPVPTFRKVSLQSPSVSSDKSVRPRSDQEEISSPDSDDKPVRPRREKPPNSMSEIEKAKIKNLKSEMKFSVKKRSQSDDYIIEYLKEKKGPKYLVKWENRHESENSWESKSKIPSTVLQV